MPAATASPPTSSAPTTSAWAVAERFARFIGGLREAMATSAEHNLVLMTLAARLWNRLTEAAERFAAIAAHPVARSRRRPAEPAPNSADAAPSLPRAPRRTLPRAYGWLARMAPETVPFGIDLAYLLGQPEMTELLATAPRLWRILRPLCRMFGITPPKAPPQARATAPSPAPDTALPQALDTAPPQPPDPAPPRAPPPQASQAAPAPDRPRRRSEAAATRDHGPQGYRPPLFAR